MSLGALPIAIILPHSAETIPPELRDRLALTQREIFNEADIYTDIIFDFRDRVTHWLRFPYARAVIDVNRPNDHEKTRPGDGIIKHRTSYGAETYIAGQAPDRILERRLIDRYWRAWHQQLQAIANNPHIKLVIDAHSMAAVGPSLYDDPSQARPKIGLCNLGDFSSHREPNRNRLSLSRQHMLDICSYTEPLVADLPTLAPVIPHVSINYPYWGGWDLWASSGKRQPWLMIELSRALYLGEQGGDSPMHPPNMAYIEPFRERVWQIIVKLFELVTTQ